MRIPALQVGVISAGLALSIALPSAPAQQTNLMTHADYAIGSLQIGMRATEPQGEVLAAQTEIPQAPIEPSLPQPVMVTVQKGDSLAMIADAHQVTVQRLFDANAFIVNPNIINPGEQIRIPFADEALATRPLPAVQPAAKPTTRTITKRVASNAPAVASGSVWDDLARCESGGNWAINTGNGYYGGLQFMASTWRAVGGTGLPHENSREEQILRGQILQARSGWGQWPHCASKLGLL